MARAGKTNGRNRSEGPAAAGETIEITGAREHNLSIERLVLPKQKLVVFTGPSGSGKSSLAFDTLYAEGQRRYVESLSTYARQFLGRLDRPAVERLRGLSPTIAIEQKSASSNPRSTVGTITEIHDYLRVLWARAGRQHCTECGKEVAGRSADEIIAEVLEQPKGAKLLLLAPLIQHRKGEFRELFAELAQRGFARVRVNGAVARLDELAPLDKKKKHTIELVVDRIAVDPESRSRIAEAVELGLKEGKGELLVDVEGKRTPLTFSTTRACCGVTYPELSPQSFSFNSPLGMCSACNGLGTRIEIDPELVIPDSSLSIRKGAIAPWGMSVERGDGWTARMADGVAKATGVDLDVPWKKLTKKQREQVLYGIEGKKIKLTWGKEGSENSGSWGMNYRGVIPTLMRRYHETGSERMRDQYRKFMRELPCHECGAKRLRPQSLYVRVGGKGLADVISMSIDDAAAWFGKLELGGMGGAIAEGPLREVRSRLTFLLNVGLDYLTLERSGPSLSGGEAQRIRLASQLGSELSGVIYVLDEPSIGLHARDNQRLIEMLQHLRDLGNSVIVVEHDEDTIRAADHLVDFGPGAGHQGGRVVFAGPPSELAVADGLTADYLSGRRRIEIPEQRRTSSAALVVKGARENNLKNVTVSFPLGVLAAVTGPSGAGKSSLVNAILLPALARHLHDATGPVGAHDEIRGIEQIDKVIAIDQQPIGRTPRSNPGTYTKAFDEIRALFAELPDARRRGWDAGRFSFNMKGGRCEACEGDGVVRVEMHFLSDVYVTCEVCQGRRYDAETLGVRYRGKSIADVLETDIDGCLALFEAHPQLARILRTLSEVGLGYVKLGQSAPTLSGGEAQRIKLSRELSRRQTGRTLYVLDEPTTGLHFEDVKRLLEVLHRLVEAGNSVLVIEHNLDVVKSADHVIDLGPAGGVEGGRVVATGTPEELAKNPKSITGPYLAEVLARGAKQKAAQRKSGSASSARGKGANVAVPPN